MAQALDLKAFIVRARVLKLYRHALRIARRAPPHSRGLSLHSSVAEVLLIYIYIYG
ncbi:hypothetical protein MA16_Dca009720 [Dendrobium catenatum]|uniref:Uncharacterized protein n=1 Tax=Dendrobium catenatum TaxID=906689 RepID=A0A2I0VQM0_9ASPA|nr:hypothetical protein MA16_Dca009720 [Dendrobium catenatum]